VSHIELRDDRGALFAPYRVYRYEYTVQLTTRMSNTHAGTTTHSHGGRGPRLAPLKLPTDKSGGFCRGGKPLGHGPSRPDTRVAKWPCIMGSLRSSSRFSARPKRSPWTPAVDTSCFPVPARTGYTDSSTNSPGQSSNALLAQPVCCADLHSSP